MIRARFKTVLVLLISLAMISWGTFSERVTKKEYAVYPIAVSIVDNKPYIYGMVGSSPYKIAIKVRPEDYVTAMSGEPVTLRLSQYDIGIEGFRWEDFSFAAGGLLLIFIICLWGVKNDKY